MTDIIIVGLTINIIKIYLLSYLHYNYSLCNPLRGWSIHIAKYLFHSTWLLTVYMVYNMYSISSYGSIHLNSRVSYTYMSGYTIILQLVNILSMLFIKWYLFYFLYSQYVFYTCICCISILFSEGRLCCLNYLFSWFIILLLE